MALSDLGRVFTVIELLKRHGQEPDILTMDTIITACSRAGNFAKAWEQLGKMQEQGLRLEQRISQTLLSCCVTHQRPAEAVELLRQMEKAGVPLKTRATEAVMRLCLTVEDLRGMEDVLAIMKSKGMTPSTELTLGLIACAAKRGNWRLTEVGCSIVVGEEAQQEAGKHLLTAYATALLFRETFQQVKHLWEAGTQLDPECLQPITDAWCFSQEVLDSAHSEVSEYAARINGDGESATADRQVLLAISNAILKGYAQRGDVERAYEVFAGLEALPLQPNQHTFCHMFEACREGRKPDSAARLFERLISEAPSFVNSTAYELLMSNLTTSNRVEDAFALLRYIKANTTRPPSHATYALLVRKLHRAGNHRAVRGLLAEMAESGQPPDVQLIRYLQKPRITPQTRTIKKE